EFLEARSLSNLRRHRPPCRRLNPRPGEEVAQFRNARECRRGIAELAVDGLGLVALLREREERLRVRRGRPPLLHWLGPRAPGFSACARRPSERPARWYLVTSTTRELPPCVMDGSAFPASGLSVNDRQHNIENAAHNSTCGTPPSCYGPCSRPAWRPRPSRPRNIRSAGLRRPTGRWFSGRGCRSLSCLMCPGWKISAARRAGRAEMGSTADTEVRLRRILLLAPGTLHVGPPASPAGPDLAENSSAKRVDGQRDRYGDW